MSSISLPLRRLGWNQKFIAKTTCFNNINRQFLQLPYRTSPCRPFCKVTTVTSTSSLSYHGREVWGETGADIVVEALEREGVTAVFGNSPCFFLTAALEHSKPIRTSIQTFPYDTAFRAAFAYTHLSSPGQLPAVCCVNRFDSWVLSKAMRNNTPVVTILISDSSSSIGESVKCVCRASDLQDIPRVVKQAFSLALSGPRPGPVVIHLPTKVTMPTRDDDRILYSKLKPVVETILDSKKPVLYMDGGCLSRSSKEVKRFVELTGGIPLASYNSNGSNIGSHLCLDYHRDLFSFQMLGGDCVDNAVRESDLLLAFGARSDDTLTGQTIKASKKKVVHIIEDEQPPCNIENQHKQDEEWNRKHWEVHSDVKSALQFMNEILEVEKAALGKHVDQSEWREELFKRVAFIEKDKAIQPHHVAQMLHELTDGEAIISIRGVRDKETWATKFYEYLKVKPTECKEYGLAMAMAALAARPNAIVVDINGDSGWRSRYDFFLMKQRNLPIKNIILHYKYGNQPHDWTKSEEYELPGARVTQKAELRAAMKNMLDTPGPYLLQVVVLPKGEVSG